MLRLDAAHDNDDDTLNQASRATVELAVMAHTGVRRLDCAYAESLAVRNLYLTRVSHLSEAQISHTVYQTVRRHIHFEFLITRHVLYSPTPT